jgi:kynureninase
MRDLFYVPDTYFLSHSVGCLPITSREALTAQFLEPWISGSNWMDWMPIFDEFRAGMAELLDVESESICPQNNISSALTKVLFSLPQESGRNVILLSKHDFPTIGFVIKQAERQGYKLRFVEGDPTRIETWEAAIDGRVAVVHITHATSNTSHILPVKEIAALAKSNGAVSIVDVAQSLGAVPVKIADWGVDFAIGTGVKFLCFGPGACFLYVAPHVLQRCEPIDVGWFSHENPFEMDIENFKYADDASRFFGGTPSPAPFVMANNAIKIWQATMPHHTHNRIEICLSRLCDYVDHKMIISPIQPNARGATFVVSPDNRAALHDKLKAKAIRYDERKEGFRFSMHGYTSDQDLDVLLGAMSKV